MQWHWQGSRQLRAGLGPVLTIDWVGCRLLQRMTALGLSAS